MTIFVSHFPTPALNMPDFDEVYGKTLPFDDQGLVRALEYIAFPRREFKIVKELNSNILEVESNEYRTSYPIYVDRRFGVIQKEPQKMMKLKMPSRQVILERMLSKKGLPYVWGGNWSSGLVEWEEKYPCPKSLESGQKHHWNFRGLDCSGLLYEATEGLTPRNTKELMEYGVEIPINKIQALDFIVYPGHVLIAINEHEVIESSHQLGGVVVSPLKKRLAEIRTPLRIRRFFQTPQDTA
ncbi:MAG: C40 family peptidase [Simkaniaceae bacterium]|nr:C40 family peptidase [Simkaniaceae bacterium]